MSMAEEFKQLLQERKTGVSTMLNELGKVENRFNEKVDALVHRLECDEQQRREAIKILSNDQPIFERPRKMQKTSSAASAAIFDTFGVLQERNQSVDIDENIEDPQLYQSLRESEEKMSPDMDYMERVQTEITPALRATLINCLVQVSEIFECTDETLFLTVNYMDRFLSGNNINMEQLQLLGVTCLMIAVKYEERGRIKVEEFRRIIIDAPTTQLFLQNESIVLNYLKFDLAVPTAKCFLRRFICAARRTNKAASLHFEHLASYILDLSLLNYSMLCFAPSLVSASATFLANLILFPSKKPWDFTMRDCTLYQPSDLRKSVKILHYLFSKDKISELSSIRDKYSAEKYEYVVQKHILSSIPAEVFQD